MLPDPEHNHFQASIFLLRFRAVELCFKAWQGLGKVLRTSLLCLALFQASTSVLGKHVISQLHQLCFCHALRSTMWKEGIDNSTMSSWVLSCLLLSTSHQENPFVTPPPLDIPLFGIFSCFHLEPSRKPWPCFRPQLLHFLIYCRCRVGCWPLQCWPCFKPLPCHGSCWSFGKLFAHGRPLLDLVGFLFFCW